MDLGGAEGNISLWMTSCVKQDPLSPLGLSSGTQEHCVTCIQELGFWSSTVLDKFCFLHTVAAM